VGQLAERLSRLCPSPRSPWRALDAHRADLAAPFDDGPDGPAAAIRAVAAALPEDAVLALDVGAHRITASQVWPSRHPRRLLQSNGLSSMGTGLPYAIAAALSGRRAAVISGDMGLWMCLGELGLAQERRLDLVVIYLSDSALSLIALKQERSGLQSQGVTFENPDVFALAAAFGGRGQRVRGAAAVEGAVRSAVDAGGLQIVEVLIDPLPYRRQM
jgi:acetolactate synthase-1/2/3 large subunit